MSIGEIDISWQSLRRIVQEWAGTSAELAEVIPLHGGAISTTVALHLKDDSKVVLKVSQHRVDRSYEREAYQLHMLKDAGLPVPEVYRWKIGTLDDPFSYILLEFVEGVDFGAAKQACSKDEFEHLQQNLAELISAMHDKTNSRYMRVMEGGESFESWPQFYRKVYDEIWHEAEKSPLMPKSCRKQIAKVHERLDQLIGNGDVPRLVHWDIWNTNLLAKRNGDGKWHVSAVLDPNCKFAHAEAEIAYMELFHTISPAFMKTYQKKHKLPPEYHQVRKHIYQLYPMINHVRLFGQEYVKPLTMAVEKTMGVV